MVLGFFVDFFLANQTAYNDCKIVYFCRIFIAFYDLIEAITVDLLDIGSNAHRDSMKRGYRLVA